MSKFINWLNRKPAPTHSTEPIPPTAIDAKELPKLVAQSNEAVLRDLAVKLAAEDLGLRETHGSNRSPMIDKMNREAGAPLGTPWCAAGLTTRVYKRLCEQQGLKLPFKCTASSQAVATMIPKRYWVAKAKAGDAFVQTKRNDPTRGHTGLVAKDMTDLVNYSTIEYNTNKLGSRDGDGVYRQSRNVRGDLTKKHRTFVSVIRYIMDENGLK